MMTKNETNICFKYGATILFSLLTFMLVFLSELKAERIYGGHFDYEPISRTWNGRTERGYRISLDVVMQCINPNREMQSVNVSIFAYDAFGMIIQDNVVLSRNSNQDAFVYPSCGCSNNIGVCTRKIRYRADYYPSDLDIANMQLFLTTSESVSDLGVCCLSQRPPVNLPQNNQNNMYSITAVLPALNSPEATMAFNWRNANMSAHDDVIFVCENDDPAYIDPIRTISLGLTQTLPNGFTATYQMVSPLKNTATQFLGTYPNLPVLQYANGFSPTLPLGTDGTVTVDATDGDLNVSGLRVDLNFPSRNRDFVVCVEVTVTNQNQQIVYVGRRFMMVSSYKKYDYATVTSDQLLADYGGQNHNGVLNLSGGGISIERQLIVTGFIKVTGGRLNFGPTARITNAQSNSFFEANNCEIGCCPNNVRYTQFPTPLQGMWDGIVADQGNVLITNNSLLECARIGIDQSSDATVEVINSRANENWRHWHIHDLALPLFPSSPSPVQVTVYGSTFQCSNPLMDQPLPNIDTHTQDGIVIENITGIPGSGSPPFNTPPTPRIIEIGRAGETRNLFRDIINNGVSAISTSDVYILNSDFKGRLGGRPSMRTGIYAINLGTLINPTLRADYTIFVGINQNNVFAPCTLDMIGRGIEMEKCPNPVRVPIARNIMSLRVDGCRFVDLGDQYWSNCCPQGSGVWVHGQFVNRDNNNGNTNRLGTRHVGNTVSINGCTYRANNIPLPFKDFPTAFEVSDAQHEGIFTNNDIRSDAGSLMSKGIVMEGNNDNDNTGSVRPRFTVDNNIIRNCQQAIIFGQGAISNDNLFEVTNNNIRNIFRGIWIMGAENGLVQGNQIRDVQRLDNYIDNNGVFRCSDDWGRNRNPGFAGVIIQNSRNMRIFSNTVSNQDLTQTSAPNWWLAEEGCNMNGDNIIDYSDSRSWRTGFNFSDGLWGGSNQGLHVCGNTAQNMIYGFCYRGNIFPNNRFMRNFMTNNLWNFVIDDQANIGPQEKTIFVSDPITQTSVQRRVSFMNQWRNNLTYDLDVNGQPRRMNLAMRNNTRHTTQNGVQSSFLTRSGQDFNNPLRNFQGVPFTNSFDLTGCRINNLVGPCTTIVNQYGGFQPIWEQTDCGETSVAPQGQPNPSPGLVGNLYIPQTNFMVDVVRGNIDFAYLAPEQTYNARFNIFRYISVDTAWRHRSPVIDSFYNANATGNMGKLLYAEQLLFGGATQPPCNASAAGTACSAVVSINQQEENQKQLLSILAQNRLQNVETFTPGQKDTVRFIARQCPETGGYAVGMARTMFALRYGQFTLDSVIHCEPNYVAPPRLGDQSQQNEILTKGEISVYPNPANEVIKIRFNEQNHSEIHLEIYSATGVRIYEEEIRQSENEVNVKGFSAGVYLCKFSSENGQLISTQKVVIR